MRADTIVVNNFYSSPMNIREYALEQDYYYPYEADADIVSGRRRATWMASRFKRWDECPFKSSEELMTRLEELTGETIDLGHWRADFPIDDAGKPAANYLQARNRTCLWNCCFHCKPDNGQQLGDGV